MDQITRLIIGLVWACLSGIPDTAKNVLFEKHFTSVKVLQQVAIAAGLAFAPGLFEVLKDSTGHPIEWFLTLPPAIGRIWAVYAILLKKPGHHSRLCVGFSLDEGFEITYQGLLC